MPITESTASLAGYRLVRMLGAGSRADVYLGAGTLGPAVLKVYRTDTTRDDIGRELNALGRLPSPHCVRLLDVATAPGGLPVAVLGRISRGSVDHLLRDRDLLEAGEAVTLLAPLAGAAAAMHLAGVAHTRIGASTVHLGASGEPVLLGFGHACLFASDAPPAAIDAEPAAMRDLDDLASLVNLVLDRVRGAGQDDRVGAVLDWLRSTAGVRRFEFAGELEAHLFSMADPLPIEFTRMPGSQLALPARLVGAGPVTPTPITPTSVTSTPGVMPTGTAIAGMRGNGAASGRDSLPAILPAWLRDSIMSNPLTLLRAEALARLATALRGVRRPLWVVAGTVGLALVLAIALVPQSGSARTGEGAKPGGSAVGQERATPLPTIAPDAAPGDPVLALSVLLETRATCVRNRSILCLDAVDEQSSEASTEDTDVVRRIQAGGESSATDVISASAPSLVERLGDSALVSLGPHGSPASALMIREKAGWRIRGYLDGKSGKP